MALELSSELELNRHRRLHICTVVFFGATPYDVRAIVEVKQAVKFQNNALWTFIAYSVFWFLSLCSLKQLIFRVVRFIFPTVFSTSFLHSLLKR